MNPIVSLMIKSVLGNPNVENAILGMVSTLAGQLLSHANNPDAIKAIALDVANKAPGIAGAILHGTPAASQASPEATKQAQSIAASVPDLFGGVFSQFGQTVPGTSAS